MEIEENLKISALENEINIFSKWENDLKFSLKWKMSPILSFWFHVKSKRPQSGHKFVQSDYQIQVSPVTKSL